MYGESNIEIYIAICELDNQQECAVWLRKLKQGSKSTQRGRWGWRWEGVSKGRAYMYTYG